MIIEAIRDFPKQFEYEPKIINGEKLGKFESAVIGGMGGSGLVAGILRMIKPELDIAAHHEYGLPKFLDKDDEKRLFVAISYSGNTEETLDFFEEALKKKLNIAAISTGGKLLELAEKKEIPHIKLPDVGIQPRMSLGIMLRATLKLLGEEKLFKETGKLAEALDSDKWEKGGKDLSEALSNDIPLIYSSRRNQSLAYNWKIKFNETGKIPAFYNTFPELNHNEMTGFDVTDTTKDLSKNIHVVILRDKDDHPRILRRMEVLGDLYENRGLSVEVVDVEGKTRAEKIFNSLMFADWAAYYTADRYDVESEQVPMVEEFKKLI